MQAESTLAAGLFAALLASGCGSATQIVPTVHTTRCVAITGARADTLAETVEGPIHGHMFVRAHDGREMWVRENHLAAPTIAVGGWVLVMDHGGIVPAEVVDVLDDYLEVRVGDLVGMAPMHAVVATLHAPPLETVSVEPAVTSDEAHDAPSDGESSGPDASSAGSP